MIVVGVALAGSLGAVVRFVVGESLRAAGCDVSEAGDGADAIEQLGIARALLGDRQQPEDRRGSDDGDERQHDEPDDGHGDDRVRRLFAAPRLGSVAVHREERREQRHQRRREHLPPPADARHHQVDLGDAQGPFTVAAELLYQPLSYRFIQDMLADGTEAGAAFESFYSAADKTPQRVAAIGETQVE